MHDGTILEKNVLLCDPTSPVDLYLTSHTRAALLYYIAGKSFDVVASQQILTGQSPGLFGTDAQAAQPQSSTFDEIHEASEITDVIAAQNVPSLRPVSLLHNILGQAFEVLVYMYECGCC